MMVLRPRTTAVPSYMPKFDEEAKSKILKKDKKLQLTSFNNHFNLSRFLVLLIVYSMWIIISKAFKNSNNFIYIHAIQPILGIIIRCK